MADFEGLNKLNPGLPKRFIDEDEAQDWLPFGATDAEVEAKRAREPGAYTEWAHWYNAWEEKGHDV